MNYQDKDEAFVNKVISSLYQRQLINANKASGTADMREDVVNPTLEFGPEDLREHTGRQKVRDVVIKEVGDAIRARGLNIEVTPLANNRVKASLVPDRPKKNQFTSLTKLQRQNADEAADDPDLLNL